MKKLLFMLLIAFPAFAQSTIYPVPAKMQFVLAVDLPQSFPLNIYTNGVLMKSLGTNEVIQMSLGSPSFKFTCPGLAVGGYRIHVTAVDGGVESDPSNAINVSATNQVVPVNLRKP